MESELDRGSSFHFTLYVRLAPGVEKLETSVHASVLSGRRLLILDDNETMRRVLARQAESWGVEPRACASLAEARRRLEGDEAFDFAVVDRDVLRSEGDEISATFSAAADLPLVLLTPLDLEELELEGEENEWPSLAAVVNKPIKWLRLFDVLRRLVTEPSDHVRIPSAAPERDHLRRWIGPLRILLAEDNVVNQKVATAMLERLGYRTDLAANGLEVLEALKRQPYDLVLMDVRMPEMDGIEATRRLKSDLAHDEHPRIIAMTASAMRGDRERCIEAGMDDYISKPIKIEDLEAALVRSRPFLHRRTA